MFELLISFMHKPYPVFSVSIYFNLQHLHYSNFTLYLSFSLYLLAVSKPSLPLNKLAILLDFFVVAYDSEAPPHHFFHTFSFMVFVFVYVFFFVGMGLGGGGMRAAKEPIVTSPLPFHVFPSVS